MRRSNAFSKNRRKISRRFKPKSEDIYKGIQLGFDEILKDGYTLDNSVDVKEVEKEDIFKTLDFNDVIESAYKEQVEPEIILGDLRETEPLKEPESKPKEEPSGEIETQPRETKKNDELSNNKSTKYLLIVLIVLIALLVLKMLWSSGVLKWILIVLIGTFIIVMFNSISSKLDDRLISKSANDLVDSVNGEESKSSGFLESNLMIILALAGVLIFLVIRKPIGSLICGALAVLSFKK